MYSIKETILKVEGVNLSYDKVILRDVNFEIHDVVRTEVTQGQIVSLIGRSGIGKTQLIKVLSGLIKPSSGTVKFGLDLKDVNAGDIGIVPQNYTLFNHRTIIDNLKLGLRGSKLMISDKEKVDIISDFANKFELTDHLKKYPMQLSGGQRQRVSIIQQILTGNKFILLDEPFSGLDPIIKDKVVKLLLDLSHMDEMNTLLIISHDLETSMAISDTALLLSKEEGKEGATITGKIDLMGMGLAWNPDIKKNKEFIELLDNIKNNI